MAEENSAAVVVMVWDNSYSCIRPKTVAYKVGAEAGLFFSRTACTYAELASREKGYLVFCCSLRLSTIAESYEPFSGQVRVGISPVQ